MVDPEAARRAYERVMVRALRRGVPVLARELDLPRRAALETAAATAALIPGGLARRTRRRPQNARAAVEVAKRFGRPADACAPELGLAAHLAKSECSPRLGGLLGDAGPALVAWLSKRHRADADAIGRAVVAVAPLVLGALTLALEPRDLGDWIATVSDAPLDDPAGLPDDPTTAGGIYRKLRLGGRPWWRRWRRAA